MLKTFCLFNMCHQDRTTLGYIQHVECRLNKVEATAEVIKYTLENIVQELYHLIVFQEMRI